MMYSYYDSISNDLDETMQRSAFSYDEGTTRKRREATISKVRVFALSLRETQGAADSRRRFLATDIKGLKNAIKTLPQAARHLAIIFVLYDSGLRN